MLGRMAIAAALFGAILLLAEPASAQQLIIAKAVVCDTQQQVEEFLALNDQAADLDATINVRHGKESCVRGSFHMAPAAIVSTAQNKEGLWSITRVLVFARVEQQVTSGYFLTAPMPEVQVWFMAFRKPQQPS